MESEEERLDIHQLFILYNSLYFENALGSCFVSWSSSTKTRSTGVCSYLEGGFCEIHLSEHLLKFRSAADIKNTLLHEMIHAYLYIISNKKDHSYHGPKFTAIMNAINSSSVTDPQRPSGGYNVTTHHQFRKKVDSFIVHQWTCQSCGDVIKTAVNKAPSERDCIESMGYDMSCGNSSCHWHKHKMLCSGRYIGVAEPPEYNGLPRLSEDAHKNDGGDFYGPSHSSRQFTRRLEMEEGMTDKLLLLNSDETMHLSLSMGTRSSFGNDTTSCSLSHGRRKSKQMKNAKLENENTVAAVIPKRSRTSACRKKRKYDCIEKKKSRKYGCPEKKKSSKCQKEINVAIPWLGYYAYESSDEDIEPLINKRTEKRKREKLFKELKGRWPDGKANYPSEDSSLTDSPLRHFEYGEGGRPAVILEEKSEAKEADIVYLSDD